MATLRVALSVLSASVSASPNVSSVRELKGARCSGANKCRWIESRKRTIARGTVSRPLGFTNVLPRPGLARAASQQVTAAESLNNTSQRESLKEKLMQQVFAVSGNLNEECIATIKELENFNPNPESLNHPELHAGYWESVRAEHLGTGRKGEAKVEVGYQGAAATLGRATFNAFEPANLEIVMGDVFNYVSKLGAEGVQRKYDLFIEFTTKNPRGDDLPPIEGLIINGATAEIESPSRIRVMFHETKLRPSCPERDLEAWKEIFEEASGGAMNEAGEISVTSKKPFPGFLDIKYIDDELRITRGNLGRYTVVRRMDKSPKFVK